MFFELKKPCSFTAFPKHQTFLEKKSFMVYSQKSMCVIHGFAFTLLLRSGASLMAAKLVTLSTILIK